MPLKVSRETWDVSRAESAEMGDSAQTAESFGDDSEVGEAR